MTLKQILLTATAVVAQSAFTFQLDAKSPCLAKVCRNDSKQVHQQALKAMATMLPREHLSGHPLDDEIASRWFERFIDELDPRRMYFTSGDLRQFSRYCNKLDDHARDGDLSFAELVRRVFTKRLRDAATLCEQFLEQDHDFTVDERFEFLPVRFVDDDVALRDRWRKRVKYDILVEKSRGLTGKEALAKIRRRYAQVVRNRQAGDDAYYEIFLRTCFEIA